MSIEVIYEIVITGYRVMVLILWLVIAENKLRNCRCISRENGLVISFVYNNSLTITTLMLLYSYTL